MALQVAINAIDRGFDLELAPIESTFLYLPFEHDEDLESQNRCVALFQGLVNRSPPELRRQFESSLSFAVRHRDVIERFGRFPHRNGLLARRSTDEELRYLESGGETFDGWGEHQATLFEYRSALSVATDKSSFLRLGHRYDLAVELAFGILPHLLLLLYAPKGLFGDLQLFIGRYYEYLHRAPVRMDGARTVSAIVIALRIDLDAEHAEPPANALANLDRVLADAGGEYDRVYSAKCSGIRADVFTDSVGVDRDGERGVLVAFLLASQRVAHVADAAKSHESATTVERGIDLVERGSGLTRNVEDQRGIEVAAPGSHDQTFERRQSH
jgi:hypothetical protein